MNLRLAAATQAALRASIRRVNRYRCGKCPYIYDPRKGDPEGGIPPGTPFSRIPDSWRCPVCGASKRDFFPLDDEVSNAPRPVTATSSSQPSQSSAVAAPLSPFTDDSPRQWTVGSLRSRPARR